MLHAIHLTRGWQTVAYRSNLAQCLSLHGSWAKNDFCILKWLEKRGRTFCAIWKLYEIQVSKFYCPKSFIGTKPHDLFTYYLCWLGAVVAEQSSCNRDHVACKAANIYHLGTLQKTFADFCTELLTIISGGWLHGEILLPILYISVLNVLKSNRY